MLQPFGGNKELKNSFAANSESIGLTDFIFYDPSLPSIDKLFSGIENKLNFIEVSSGDEFFKS